MKSSWRKTLSKKIDLATAIDSYQLAVQFSSKDSLKSLTNHVQVAGKTFNKGTPLYLVSKYLTEICKDFNADAFYQKGRMTEEVDIRNVEGFPTYIKRCFLDTKFEGYHVYSEQGNRLTNEPFAQIPTYEQLQIWAWTGMVNNNL